MQENTGKIVFLVPDYLTFCYKTNVYCNEMKIIVLQKRGSVTKHMDELCLLQCCKNKLGARLLCAVRPSYILFLSNFYNFPEQLGSSAYFLS